MNDMPIVAPVLADIPAGIIIPISIAEGTDVKCMLIVAPSSSESASMSLATLGVISPNVIPLVVPTRKYRVGALLEVKPEPLTDTLNQPGPVYEVLKVMYKKFMAHAVSFEID